MNRYTYELPTEPIIEQWERLNCSQKITDKTLFHVDTHWKRAPHTQMEEATN